MGIFISVDNLKGLVNEWTSKLELVRNMLCDDRELNYHPQ
jgi:hypothetical protein